MNYTHKNGAIVALVALFMGLWQPMLASGPVMAATNLIANPSVETVSPTDSTQPNHWLTDQWGQNTASFAYPNNGYTGSRSVKVTVSNYQSGDAKWYFAPVDVTPGETYQYSDYFKSDGPSFLVAMVIMSDGSLQYYDTTPTRFTASSAWSLAMGQITMPAGAKQATIFHLIHRNGWLQTDDFNFHQVVTSTPTPTPTPTPSGANLIANPSFESGSTNPTSWYQDFWGNNTRVFAYVTTAGHTGSHSAKVMLSNYTTGDAKWAFNPINATVDQPYQWSDWYESSVNTTVTVQFDMTDGSQYYLPIAVAGPSTTWKQVSGTFTAPAGAKDFTVMHYISSNGWLSIDDASVTTLPVHQLSHGLVSVTIDENSKEDYTIALPLLQKYGIKSTQFFTTDPVKNNQDPDYTITADEVKEFAADGHEIGDHTNTHPSLISLTPAQIDSELSTSKQYLEQLTGQTVVDFASPYGDYNASVIGEVQKYFQSHRGTDEGYNDASSFNPYFIYGQNVESTTTAAQIESWIDYANAHHMWLVLIFHDVIASGGDEWSTTPQIFESVLSYLKSTGTATPTMKDARAEIAATNP